MRLRPFVFASLVAVASCDLYFPDHRVEVEGVVRDGNGSVLPKASVTLRRSRFLYDTPLASAETDATGSYRVTYRLEGCSELFDGFRIVAEWVVGSDTTRAEEAVECADGVQEVNFVFAADEP